MTKIELFDHHDIMITCIEGKLEKEYLYMDKYRVFVDEIINNKELTYHKELEPYRKNLSLLLSLFKVEGVNIYGKSICLTTYIDMAVSLAIDLNNIEINKLILSYIKAMRQDEEISLKLIRALYIPETIEKLESYIYLMDLFCAAYFTTYTKFEKYQKSTGNNELNGFYKYLSGIYNKYNKYDYDEMISIIFAHLHKNGIHSYEMIDKYLSDHDYYSDKLRNNDFRPCFFPHQFLYVNARYLYDNIESFLSNGKEIR